MKNKEYNYPIKYDEHMIDVPAHRKIPTLDGEYPYRDLSFKGKLSRFFTYFALRTIGFPIIWLLCGLKIKGRENLKKHKELLKDGAISICNHVHMWDAVCLLKALRPIKINTPAWPTNLRGPNAALIRGVGGLPVPTGMSGMRKFSDTMDTILDEKKWLHFYPETAMWFYYDAIRPFKKGAFTLAVKHNKPIVPLCITYRPAKGIRKIFGQPQFLTITVGEPIMPNLTLERNEAVADLLKRSRETMQNLGGFKRTIPQTQTERPN